MEWAGDRVQIRSQGSLTMLASLCMLYALQVRALVHALVSV